MQYAYEASYVRVRCLSRERIFSRKIDNRLGRTNHDLAFEREFFGDRRAQNRFADISAHHKRPDRANIHDPKFSELLSDQRRLTSVCSTDVYCAKKDDGAHATIKK